MKYGSNKTSTQMRFKASAYVNKEKSFTFCKHLETHLSSRTHHF